MNKIDNIILESNDLIKSMEDNLIKLLCKINDQITELKKENTILHYDNKKLYDENINLNNRLKLYQSSNFPINRPCGTYLVNMILNDNNQNSYNISTSEQGEI
tara:strand:- start:2430 stop:2738 length:309 start_codon:yes stop_codon:yes gene_type:complete